MVQLEITAAAPLFDLTLGCQYDFPSRLDILRLRHYRYVASDTDRPDTGIPQVLGDALSHTGNPLQFQQYRLFHSRHSKHQGAISAELVLANLLVIMTLVV